MLELRRFTDVLNAMDEDATESSGGKGSMPQHAIMKMQKAVLPWFLLIAIIKVLDQGDSPFNIPSFLSDLKMSDLDNMVSNMFFLTGIFLFMIPSTLLQAKVGNAKWLACLVAAGGVTGLLMALVRGADGLIIVRFLVGICMAGVTPGAYIFMASFFTHHELSVGVGIFTAGRILGQVIQSPIATGLLSMDKMGHVRGWQMLFSLVGLVSIGLGAALWTRMPKELTNLNLLSGEERDWLQQRQDAITRVARSRAREAGTAWAPFITWRMYRLCIAWMLLQAVQTSLLYFAPLYIRGILTSQYLGTTPENAVSVHPWKTSFLAAALYIPSIIATIALAWDSFKMQERRYHVAVPLILGSIPLVMTPVITDSFGPGMGYMMLVLATLASCAVAGPVISWCAALFHGRALLTAFPMILFFGSIGEMWLGPSLVRGFVAMQASGVHPVLVMLGMLQAMTGLLFLSYQPADVVPSQAQEVLPTTVTDNEALLPQRVAQE